MRASRETLLVELVDERGTAVGSATVGSAHTAPGRLHRAFSVFLLDAAGRVLLQRRAATKSRFPQRWANTCCGHPLPGQPVVDAARSRLVDELGVAVAPLRELGVYTYYAEDPATGLVEYEYDHVLLGTLPSGQALRPDPSEVDDVRWIRPDELPAALRADSRSFAPWVAGVTDVLLQGLGPAAVPPEPPVV